MQVMKNEKNDSTYEYDETIKTITKKLNIYENDVKIK